MKITTVLFDLDGTLLPMDQDVFTKTYFKLLASKLAPHGYDPQKLINDIWAGTAAMVKNDGSCKNEEAFWKTFSGIYGSKALDDKHIFDEFYRVDFQNAVSACQYTPMSKEVVGTLKDKGLRTVLATNPIFPAIATESRIRWAGLQPEDFELYTTYENSSFCKPNPDYYREIINKLGVDAEECLMVGNDVSEDMAAAALGMEVFLLTDCMINRESKDISVYHHGGFDRLMEFIQKL